MCVFQGLSLSLSLSPPTPVRRVYTFCGPIDGYTTRAGCGCVERVQHPATTTTTTTTTTRLAEMKKKKMVFFSTLFFRAERGGSGEPAERCLHIETDDAGDEKGSRGGVSDCLPIHDPLLFCCCGKGPPKHRELDPHLSEDSRTAPPIRVFCWVDPKRCLPLDARCSCSRSPRSSWRVLRR